MCGIFGYVSNCKYNDRVSSKDIFKNLLLLSEMRGKEASGFGIYDKRNHIIFVHKVPYPGHMLVKSNEFNDIFSSLESDSCFVGIGHSRLATSGDEQNNFNNQPVARDGIVLVHNGIIVNIESLWRRYIQYRKHTDLDSEIIPVILNHYLSISNSIKESISIFFEEIEGVANIAFLNARNNCVTIASNNGSLFYAIGSNGTEFIFASERNILEHVISKNNLSIIKKSIIQLEPNQFISYNFCNFNIVTNFSGNSVTVENKQASLIEEIPYKRSIKRITNGSFERKFNEVPNNLIDFYLKQKDIIANLKRCKKCILPKTFPYIEFDNQGVCNYCNNYKKYEIKGEYELQRLAHIFKKKDNRPEVLVGLSGGRDSCYALHYFTRELGFKAIAFSYDWGMLTDLARRNQSRLCAKLGVEHILVSADIRKKRENIRKNVSAWLRSPNLGIIPLFMAGDKQYFYYAHKIMKENSINLIVFGENLLESTFFKYGFCNIRPNLEAKEKSFTISKMAKFKMIMFYFEHFLKNPKFINSSILDSIGAYGAFYYIPHKYLNIFHYIKWDENLIIDTLINNYNWESDAETKSTWRIGDGTAAFYNYIYYVIAGFTENDTFRSNQIREGDMLRETALALSITENRPRWNSIQWYCRTIGIDFKTTIERINKIPKLYD